MHNPAKLLARTCTFACILFFAVSCKETDDFFKDKNKTVESDVNAFDFSTSQEVDLIVDYSEFDAKIPVFFSVYKENPIKMGSGTEEYIDESIKPLFSGYTESDGTFDETITLPSYVNAVCIVTGNFLVGLRSNFASIDNGKAEVKVNKPQPKNESRRKVGRTNESTNDLSDIPQLYKTSGGKEVYKPWQTPLGTWNSSSGRPDYLLDKNNPANSHLVFSQGEFTSMYGTACDALNSGTNLKESYRQASDMEVVDGTAEISITALGSSTCWNSSLGYYYYTGDAPTDKTDLNIIMLFPNTQDGEWPRGKYPNNEYNGNKGMLRGDVIQLMYFPNIANGDYSGASKTFPVGTKIGFILKTNAWGSRGASFAVNGSSYAGKKNIWAATTDGLSSALDSNVKYPNPNGEARSAKFSYIAPSGTKYAIVSFEDACDDKDYDDLMFALNPASAFKFEQTAIESRRVSVEGVYGFEDKWPEAGDYDMNDLMINCRHELEFYTHIDGSNKLNKERFYLTTYHNYITYTDGLAVDLQASDIATIYVNKLLPGQTEFASEDYKMYNKMYYYLPEIRWGGNDNTKETRIWYLTDDIKKGEDQETGEGVTWVFEVTYTKAVNKGQCTIRPFLWRNGTNGQVEVHLPWTEPTKKADTSLFGTRADKSNPNVKKSNGQKMYYVGDGEFPFAFYLEGTSIDVFRETILKLENESKRIDTFFPEFLEWSISEGKKNSNWYLKHLTNEEVIPE